MDGKDPYKREDDEKKKNDQKLSQLEQDILAKNQGRGSGNARPGVVAMTSSSASSTGTSSGASNLSQLEQDIASKTKASPGSSGRVDSRPGASAVGTGVSSFQQLTPNAHLSRLEQDIAAKTQARSSSSYSTAGTGTGTGSLSRLERDIMIKAQSSGRQSGIPASRPGVVPANTNQGNGGLSQLEQDIAAKSQSRGGAASRPGAVSSGGSGHLTQLEQDIAAKTGGALNSAARPGAIRSGEAGNLSQLERAIAAKTGTDRSLGVATAPARLNHLEQDAMAKTRGGSVSASRPGAVAASESGANMGNQKGMNSSKNGAVSAGVGGALTRFEQDIVTKTGGIVPTSSVASRNLSQLEQDLLSKARGSSAGSSVHHTLPTSSVLQRLEDDVSAKQAAMSLRPSGGGHSALMHMEQGISGNGSIATGHSFEPRDIGNFGTSEKDVVGQVQHQNSYDHRSQLQNTYQNTDNSGYYSGDTDNDISSGYNGNYNDSDTRIIDEYAQSREFDSRATSSNYRSNGDDNFNDRLNIEYEAARLASYAPGVTAADLAEHQDPEAPLYTVPISSLDSSPTGGIEAFVAENVVDATGVAVIKSDEEEETEIKTRQRKCMMWMTVAVLVLLAGVIVPVAVLSGSDETIKVTPSPTMSPTMTPTMSPTSSSIPRLVNELEAYSLATDLKDRNTPQGKAVAWIANDPFVINEGYIPTDPKFIQRYALAVFYFALGGESWRVCGEKDESCPNGWLQNTSDCSWFLLQCDDNGMLTSMDFTEGQEGDYVKKGTALTGIIAPEIRHLTTLKRLVIPSMNVGGKILEYIENFSSLVDLSISRCNFDGSFVETFGYYHPNLVTLDLAENGFSGPIPESFGRLVNLTLLDLSQNSFEGQIPSLLGQIPVLSTLTLEDNKFVGDLPVEIYNSNIKKLQVGGNSLTGLIKTEIGLMVRLTHFDIGPSKMSGEIPAELYMLTSLEELNLGSSSFSGQVLDTGLGKMLRLRTLILQNNNFNGPFPIGTLENVTTLEEVRMQNNSFVGVITDKVCDSRGREPELLVLDVDCSTVECSCCDGDDCES